MAAGKSGYITFSASNSYGHKMEARIGWEETYDIEKNISVIKITSLECRNNYGGVWYPGGTLKVNDETLVTMNSEGNATHRFDLIYGGEEWSAIRTWHGGSIPPWTSSEIAHNADGSKSVSISFVVSMWKDANAGGTLTFSGSQTIHLTTIPRASEITSAGNVTLGSACNVKWTPKAAAFRYKLKFSLGDWSYTTGAIHPNKTTEHTYSGYAIPLEAANQIPNAKTGTMKVELFTYSDSSATVQVGSADSETFTVTVPDNSNTKPAVTMELAPVSNLAAKFAGLYIQGKTKVKATLTAEGKFNASIKSKSMKAAGITYDSDDSYTSGYLTQTGKDTVYGYATDSRGFLGSTSKEITVIGYSGPKIHAASGESDVVAARCDANGNPSDTGTYLKIKAKRSYAPVVSGGVQKNFCQIRYRYKLESAANYSGWTTILAGSDLSSDEIVTGALLGGVLSTTSSYVVQVQAVDDIGESATTTLTVMTEEVYMHRTKNAMGLGKYVEGENLLDVAWDTHLRGEVRIGASGMTLREYILAVISEGG